MGQGERGDAERHLAMRRRGPVREVGVERQEIGEEELAAHRWTIARRGAQAGR